MADVFDMIAANPKAGKPIQAVKPIAGQDVFDLMETDAKLNTEGARQQAEFERLGVPQGGGRQASMTVPKPSASNDIVHALNAVPEYVGTEAGKYVQSAVEPYVGGTGSDIAGALVKEGIQFFGPQVGSSLARMGLKTLAKVAPGAQGGKMERLIGQTEKSLQGMLDKTGRSQAGYQRAVDKIPAGDTTPLANTLTTLDNLIAKERAHGITDARFLHDAEALKKEILSRGSAPDLKWIDGELTRIGEKTKAVIQGQPSNPGYKTLFASMAKDLESNAPRSGGTFTKYDPVNKRFGGQTVATDVQNPASTDIAVSRIAPGLPLQARTVPKAAQANTTDSFTVPQGQISTMENPQMMERLLKPSGRGTVIRAKDEAMRRNFGMEQVVDEFNKMVRTKRGTAGAEDINANQLMDKLKKNEFLQGSLRAEDWQEIEPILAKLADTAALPPPAGASFGSGRAMARGSVAGGLAYLFGGDPVSTGAAVTGLDYLAGHMLMSKKGRETISKILDMNTLEKSQKLNLINAAARMAFEETPKEEAPKKNVKKPPTLQELGLR